MRLVDVDGDAATFDSSSSQLSLPAGARVLYAALYTGARTEAGTRGSRAADATPTALGTVLLKVPGSDQYARLGADTATVDQSTTVKGAYQTVHDVTDLVRNAGAGDYSVADVQAATGIDRYAGWALMVAYAAPGDPPRNLSIFDGLRAVTRGQPPLSIPLSGFVTPETGAVNTQVGLIAYEGDLGSGGDGLAINGQPLSDAASPATNFFDSGISIDGVPWTQKTPDYRNQLGFDAKLVRADGVLANGSASASLSLTTSLEQYLPGAVSFATDLYSPDVQVDKTVENVTDPGQPARPGDRLRYALTYSSRGPATAQDVMGSDPLPDGVTLMPGSLRIGDQSQTDPAGDDLGDYDPSTRTVRFFLGEGASAQQGGSLVVGAQTTVSFEVQVDPTPTEGELVNAARSTVSGGSLAEPLQAVSAPARIEVRPAEAPVPVADVGDSQQETVSDAGGIVETTDSITVTDQGPDPATDVQTELEIPAGETVRSVKTDDGGCITRSTEITCTIDRLPDRGAAQIQVVEDEPAADMTAVPMSEATTTADQLDEDAANNATITPQESEPVPELARDDATLITDITPHASRNQTGRAVHETVTVRDAGPGDADHVELEVAPSRPLDALRVHGRGAHCTVAATVSCTTRQLAAGQTVRIAITGHPRHDGVLRFSADASSDRFDPHPSREVAYATSRVRSDHQPLGLALATPAAGLIPGERAHLTVVVDNPLDRAVRHVSVCASVPRPLALLTGRRYCWTVALLPAGHARRLTTTVLAADNARPGSIKLTAAARARGVPPASARARLAVHRPFTGCAPLAGAQTSGVERPDC